MRLEISDWRNVPYAEAWDRQTACFDALVHAKQVGEEYVNHIILCEHPHVYTLGRSGKEGNMLLSEEQLSAVGASLYHIDRGGDITYHGPVNTLNTRMAATTTRLAKKAFWICRSIRVRLVTSRRAATSSAA